MFRTDTASRRHVLRALVAAGGATALAACLGDDDEIDVPAGVDDPGELPPRQHAWNEFLERDDDGNVRPPEHHVLLPLELERDPTDEDRKSVEETLQGLERAIAWSNEGLVFTLGYTPAYFERFDAHDVDLPAPTPLTEREEGELAVDEFDALLHLASDEAAVALAAEEALFGELDELNGEPVETDLTDVFSRVEDHRRTGFVGPGLPAEETDVTGVPDSVPEDAPFFMGFRSGFRSNQASEDAVTLESGPFAGGTTQHLSTMGIQLHQWLEQDSHDQRVAKLFSPEQVGELGSVGETLGTDSGVAVLDIDELESVAREEGVVGHAQKTAAARIDGEPPLLRRDVNTVDGDQPGLHFLSLQADVEAFVAVRQAMEATDLPVSRQNNGILHYLFVRRRGNYLVPPREHRALPDPSA